jgi:hypothetical protein
LKNLNGCDINSFLEARLKKRKPGIRDDVKLRLQEIRESLAGITLDDRNRRVYEKEIEIKR